MTPHTEVEHLLLECRNARTLLKEILDLRTLYPDEPARFSGTLAKLARQYDWFAHSAVDALCLYFQREDADPVTGGAAIGHLTNALVELGKNRASGALQDWAERHAERVAKAAPHAKAETAFKTVLRAIMALQPRGARSSAAWWLERAEEHKADCLFPHFLRGYEACHPDAIAAHARPIAIDA